MRENSFAPRDFRLVKSTAVEDHVPDIVTARELKLEQIMRSDLLAEMFNKKSGLAIGGTAGKTTTTGLLAWIFKFTGQEPSCAVGGIISGLETNALNGRGPHFIIEADESDGSIVKYQPQISVVTNISRDHKDIEELFQLFTSFLQSTRDLRLVCGDDENTLKLAEKCNKKVLTYGFGSHNDFVGENLVIEEQTTSFTYSGTCFRINLPGEHNALNTLAAIIVASHCGIETKEISKAIEAFVGMKRRFEKIGTAAGVTVIDDFAHNPVEIEAAIKTARRNSRKRFIVYQPHGYGPTSFTRNELISVFSKLRADEYLFLDDIYYGGGTVNKNISSAEIVAQVRTGFKNAWHIADRERLIEKIADEAREGDMVLVMGARDINSICTKILDRLSNSS
jgi:UDP-N-acetylmuramate--alanine ligase